MRRWKDDHTYGLNFLSFVRGRGEIASLLYDIVLKKGLPTSDGRNWSASERILLESMEKAVIHMKF